MAQAETVYSGVTRAFRGGDPFLLLWRLLTSVRFALALIGFLALAGLLAVVLPQIPEAMEGNDVAVSLWLNEQEDTFGALTQPMYRVGLFDVVSAWWFVASLWLLVASVSVNTVNRFPSIWRNIVAPQERVPDSFFERAGNRVLLPLPSSTATQNADSIERALHQRRFKVRRFDDGQTTYLFGDRFSFTQLGTFVSHLALILFLAGALISSRGAFKSDLFVAEGTTSPVFAVSDPNQMQVEVLDASATFDEDGTPVDYHTDLVIYQSGREVARGTSTVNDPLSYDGYSFHQSSFQSQGAALRVRDEATGNTLYSEALAMNEAVPAPAITVTGSGGETLVEDVIVPTDFLSAGAAGTLITVPGDGGAFWVGTQSQDGEWTMLVYSPNEPDDGLALRPGETRSLEGLDFTFNEPQGLPSIITPGIPGDSENSNAILSQDPDGVLSLTVLGPVEGRALVLREGAPVSVNGREYLFEGRREFTGIQVRKDPGANFIWVATGLLLAGLAISFYLPRLRLWARVTDEETVIAGLAERSGPFRSETDRLARELGIPERDASLDRHADPD